VEKGKRKKAICAAGVGGKRKMFPDQKKGGNGPMSEGTLEEPGKNVVLRAKKKKWVLTKKGDAGKVTGNGKRGGGRTNPGGGSVPGKEGCACQGPGFSLKSLGGGGEKKKEGPLLEGRKWR